MLLFSINVETHFVASHQLVLPDGSKEPLHRHDWTVIADLGSERLNRMGLVMDFRRLKAMVDTIIGEFADGVLEEFDYFRRNGSSAEMIAEYLYNELESKLPKAVALNYISVAEEPGRSAKFSK